MASRGKPKSIKNCSLQAKELYFERFVRSTVHKTAQKAENVYLGQSK